MTMLNNDHVNDNINDHVNEHVNACVWQTNAYIHQKEVQAAQGVKIIAKDLEKALAGLPMYIAHDKDEMEYFQVDT